MRMRSLGRRRQPHHYCATDTRRVPSTGLLVFGPRPRIPAVYSVFAALSSRAGPRVTVGFIESGGETGRTGGAVRAPAGTAIEATSVELCPGLRRLRRDVS